MEKKRTGKKYGYFAILAGCAVVLFCGCAGKRTVDGALITSAFADGQGGVAPVGENGTGDMPTEVPEPEETSLMLFPAKHEVVLSPGSMAKGIFDDSRESISVLCEEADGEQVLYVDGKEVLRTAKNDTILLYDIDPEDAFLELVVGGEFSRTENVYGEKDRKTTVYRVHPGELTEIAFLPLREDNSFLTSWYELLSFSSRGMVDGYRLKYPGYLVPERKQLTPICIDGEIRFVPSKQVAISEKYPLAIAWIATEPTAETRSEMARDLPIYDVYRSTDGGVTWSRAAEQIIIAQYPFETIYILDESTVFTCFDIGALCWQRMVMFSEDGGFTWQHADKKEYWFLYQGGEDPAEEFRKVNKKKEEEAFARTTPLSTDDLQQRFPAKSQVVLTPGSMARGIFDDSRETICLVCKEEDGQKVLYVDEKKALTVDKDKKIMLFDMDERDAFLELLVMEEVANEKETEIPEAFRKWKINAYRVHPGELAEVALLPLREDNSFVVDEWNFACQNNYIWLDGLGEKSGRYCITTLGYLIREEQGIIPITVDGEVHRIPKDQVAIYEDCNLAIAFEEQWGMMSTAHYNIYHSIDGGVTWSLAAEDFCIAYAPFEAIHILDDSTALVCLGLSGVTGVRSGYISKDGGSTWEYLDTDAYWFLGLLHSDVKAP